ncbi:hypothetical protein Tco_0096608 [Tanacetum coccineum]
MINLTKMLTKFINANSASTSGSGSLPRNIVANSKGDMKSLTPESGVYYMMGLKFHLSAHFLLFFLGGGTRTRGDKGYGATKHRKHSTSGDDLLALKFMEMFRNLHFELSFADALLHMPKFAPMFRKLLNNKDKIIDLIKTPSGNPTPTLEPILSTSPTSLTPFEGGDFILEEIEACLTSESIPPGIDDADFDPKEDLLTLERLLNSDPSSTLPLEEQKFEELKTIEPSSDELPELELKDLPPHLEYAFLEGTDKLPVIIAKDLKDEDKTALLKVLRSHKHAIAWKMSDIKGIDPKFCTHKILMEDNVKPTVQQS